MQKVSSRFMSRVAVTLLLSTSSIGLKSQGTIHFILPAETVDDTIQIDLYQSSRDSNKLVHTFRIPPKCNKVNYDLTETDCLNGIPMSYSLNTTHRTYSGGFIGSCYPIKINIETGKILLNETHPLYQIYNWENSYAENPSVGDSIDAEVLRLRKNNIYPNFLDFVIYRSTLNGFMNYKDLAEKIGIDTIDSYWINALRSKLAEKSDVVTGFLHSLDSLNQAHDTILLKFWGEWCAPCRIDNSVITEIIQAKSEFPFVIGIQKDDVLTLGTKYVNFLDRNGFIANYYSVTAYPTYIVIAHDTEVLRTNSLNDVQGIGK